MRLRFRHDDFSHFRWLFGQLTLFTLVLLGPAMGNAQPPGDLQPLRSIKLPGTGFSRLRAIGVDGSGLYGVIARPGPPSRFELVHYPSTTDTPTWQRIPMPELPGVGVYSPVRLASSDAGALAIIFGTIRGTRTHLITVNTETMALSNTDVDGDLLDICFSGRALLGALWNRVMCIAGCGPVPSAFATLHPSAEGVPAPVRLAASPDGTLMLVEHQTAKIHRLRPGHGSPAPYPLNAEEFKRIPAAWKERNVSLLSFSARDERGRIYAVIPKSGPGRYSQLVRFGASGSIDARYRLALPVLDELKSERNPNGSFRPMWLSVYEDQLYLAGGSAKSILQYSLK